MWRSADGLVAYTLAERPELLEPALAIAPFAMVVVGTLGQWREWTGEPFDTSGPVPVPGDLAPVLSDLDGNVGTYVEPNVWVRHSIAPRPRG